MIRCTTCRKFHVIGFDYGHESTNTLPRREGETMQEWVDRFMADARVCANCGKPEGDHAAFGNWCESEDEDYIWSRTRKFTSKIAERQFGGMPESEWKRLEHAHLEAGTGVNDREY